MDELLKALKSSRIRSELASKITKTYEQARRANLLGTSEDLSTSCGRFTEQAIAIIWEEAMGQEINLNNIAFEKIYLQIEALPKSKKETELGELLYATLPRVLRAMYTIRTKKEGAHTKSLEVEDIDKQVIMDLCNWTIAQILFVFCNDKKTMEGILPKILLKKMPSFQEFEDGRITVFNNLSEEKALLFRLYLKDKNRISRDELSRISGLKKSSLSTYLRRLKGKNKEKMHYLDENNAGILITNLGRAHIERNPDKYFALNKVKL